MKTYEIYNIQWDTESDGVVYDAQKLGLPSSVIVKIDDNEDIEETINDTLANNFDWCVFGWEIREVS